MPLKKKLLSTTQKTSCCPPCRISDREGFGKINNMTKWRERIQNVPDTKSSLSTIIQKSCVSKLFHSRERIQKVPFSRIFLCGYVRCSVDGRPNRNNKVAFSNLSGLVWTSHFFPRFSSAQAIASCLVLVSDCYGFLRVFFTEFPHLSCFPLHK